MNIKVRFVKQSGTILIMALWLLALLTFFALELGFGIRQKISLASRLSRDQQLYLWAESGVNKAIAIINEQLKKDDFLYSADGKQRWHNNPEDFSEIKLGAGTCTVGYRSYDVPDPRGSFRYGVVDESAKININFADRDVLQTLFVQALGLDEAAAKDLSERVLEWQGRFTFPDEKENGATYYSRLEYPYAMRQTPFANFEELKLVKGMDADKVDKLLPFITVYDYPAININTSSEFILRTIGISSGLVEKILCLRRGGDGLDGTRDDFIFTSFEDIVSDIMRSSKLSSDEYNELLDLVANQKIRINSRFFMIESTSNYINGHFQKRLICVYDAVKKRIVYWRES